MKSAFTSEPLPLLFVSNAIQRRITPAFAVGCLNSASLPPHSKDVDGPACLFRKRVLSAIAPLLFLPSACSMAAEAEAGEGEGRLHSDACDTDSSPVLLGASFARLQPHALHFFDSVSSSPSLLPLPATASGQGQGEPSSREGISIVCNSKSNSSSEALATALADRLCGSVVRNGAELDLFEKWAAERALQLAGAGERNSPELRFGAEGEDCNSSTSSPQPLSPLLTDPLLRSPFGALRSLLMDQKRLFCGGRVPPQNNASPPSDDADASQQLQVAAKDAAAAHEILVAACVALEASVRVMATRRKQAAAFATKAVHRSVGGDEGHTERAVLGKGVANAPQKGSAAAASVPKMKRRGAEQPHSSSSSPRTVVVSIMLHENIRDLFGPEEEGPEVGEEEAETLDSCDGGLAESLSAPEAPLPRLVIGALLWAVFAHASGMHLRNLALHGALLPMPSFAAEKCIAEVGGENTISLGDSTSPLLPPARCCAGAARGAAGEINGEVRESNAAVPHFSSFSFDADACTCLCSNVSVARRYVDTLRFLNAIALFCLAEVVLHMDNKGDGVAAVTDAVDGDGGAANASLADIVVAGTAGRGICRGEGFIPVAEGVLHGVVTTAVGASSFLELMWASRPAHQTNSQRHIVSFAYLEHLLRVGAAEGSASAAEGCAHMCANGGDNSSHNPHPHCIRDGTKFVSFEALLNMDSLRRVLTEEAHVEGANTIAGVTEKDGTGGSGTNAEGVGGYRGGLGRDAPQRGGRSGVVGALQLSAVRSALSACGVAAMRMDGRTSQCNSNGNAIRIGNEDANEGRIAVFLFLSGFLEAPLGPNMRDALVHSKQGEAAAAAALDGADEDEGAMGGSSIDGPRGAVTMLNHIIKAMLGVAASRAQASHAEAAPRLGDDAQHMGRMATSLLWPFVMRWHTVPRVLSDAFTVPTRCLAGGNPPSPRGIAPPSPSLLKSSLPPLTNAIADVLVELPKVPPSKQPKGKTNPVEEDGEGCGAVAHDGQARQQRDTALPDPLSILSSARFPVDSLPTVPRIVYSSSLSDATTANASMPDCVSLRALGAGASNTAGYIRRLLKYSECGVHASVLLADSPPRISRAVTVPTAVLLDGGAAARAVAVRSLVLLPLAASFPPIAATAANAPPPLSPSLLFPQLLSGKGAAAASAPRDLAWQWLLSFDASDNDTLPADGTMMTTAGSSDATAPPPLFAILFELLPAALSLFIVQGPTRPSSAPAEAQRLLRQLPELLSRVLVAAPPPSSSLTASSIARDGLPSRKPSALCRSVGHATVGIAAILSDLIRLCVF